MANAARRNRESALPEPIPLRQDARLVMVLFELEAIAGLPPIRKAILRDIKPEK
jgi:hypothetical protein